MKNNISDLAPKRKTDFEKIKEFEKWMCEKVKNIHRGNIQKMGDAYERLLTN